MCGLALYIMTKALIKNFLPFCLLITFILLFDTFNMQKEGQLFRRCPDSLGP